MNLFHKHKWEIVRKGDLSERYPDTFFITVRICKCGKLSKIGMTSNYKVAGYTYEEVRKLFN